MQEFRLNQKSDESLVKVFLNENDDYVMLNQNDASFFDRYSQIVSWLNAKQAEYEKLVGEYQKKYKGKKMFEEMEDGSLNIDSEQLSDFANLRTDLCKECVKKINILFGENTIEKFFRSIYDVIPDFIPDEDCIYDFFEEMSPVVSALFNKRIATMRSSYSKGRTGKHNKTKEQLIEEYNATK